MENFASSDGVAIAFERRGAGPRVYVCHGGPANDHRYIADDLDALTERVEFVFWDYRGSGASDTADSSSYTLDRFARDLDELRRHLGDDSIVVLGHSMGGFVALAFALSVSEHCASLILAGTWPSNAPRQILPATLRALGGARFAKMIGRGCAWVVMYSWRHKSAEARRRLYAIWSTMQEGRPSIREAEAAREVRLGLPLDNDNVRPLQRQFASWDLTDRLGDVTCPVLLLYGSRDAAAVAGARTFVRYLPHAVQRPLHDIGHDPFFEDLATASVAIESFLATPEG
jgi:pimeloyl-ACP methyl ester carboxylesterase